MAEYKQAKVLDPNDLQAYHDMFRLLAVAGV